MIVICCITHPDYLPPPNIWQKITHNFFTTPCNKNYTNNLMLKFFQIRDINKRSSIEEDLKICFTKKNIHPKDILLNVDKNQLLLASKRSGNILVLLLVDSRLQEEGPLEVLSETYANFFIFLCDFSRLNHIRPLAQLKLTLFNLQKSWHMFPFLVYVSLSYKMISIIGLIPQFYTSYSLISKTTKSALLNCYHLHLTKLPSTTQIYYMSWVFRREIFFWPIVNICIFK